MLAVEIRSFNPCAPKAPKATARKPLIAPMSAKFLLIPILRLPAVIAIFQKIDKRPNRAEIIARTKNGPPRAEDLPRIIFVESGHAGIIGTRFRLKTKIVAERRPLG